MFRRFKRKFRSRYGRRRGFRGSRLRGRRGRSRRRYGIKIGYRM